MERTRARDLGIVIGTFRTGTGNAITDVAGVRVGHSTLVSDDPVVARTGVTVVWPHAGTPWRDRVYVGTSILNGYGELIGINQLNEWGLLHTPVVLASSLAIGFAYDATARWIAERFKGGIGTASRVLDEGDGGFTVGALVSTNFGSRRYLTIDGVRVGAEIGDLMPEEHSEGSCIVVVATDAPMLPHQLRRLAHRAELGLARTGSIGANGSGELLLAFSTAQTIPREAPGSVVSVRALLDGAYWQHPSAFDPLFAATIEAVEEAVVNALVAATTTEGRDGHVLHALPVDRTLEILDRHGRLRPGREVH